MYRFLSIEKKRRPYKRLYERRRVRLQIARSADLRIGCLCLVPPDGYEVMPCDARHSIKVVRSLPEIVGRKDKKSCVPLNEERDALRRKCTRTEVDTTDASAQKPARLLSTSLATFPFFLCIHIEHTKAFITSD